MSFLITASGLFKVLDSPDEQAEEFKKDGTFHFKHKLYKKAIIAYSKAIAVKPTDKKLLVSTLIISHNKIKRSLVMTHYTCLLLLRQVVIIIVVPLNIF